jgi:hypothetical protein
MTSEEWPGAGPIPDESPAIEVEPLGEATPPPWPPEPEAATDAANQGAMTDQDAAERLAGLIAAPFWAMALIRGEHWMVTEAEVAPIAANLAKVIPHTWWMDRALALSPWGLAGVGILGLVRVRLAIDAAQAAKESTGGDNNGQRGAPARGPRAAGGGGPGEAGGAGLADARPDDDFEGAGLGPPIG